VVLLPFDRARLRARNAIDDAEQLTEAARLSPSQRIEQSLELSQLVIDLARAAGAPEGQREVELAEKARLFVAPLRASAPK
jgi:hypothetical protein